MAAFLDVCRFNPTAGGTTDWTYSSAVTGYQSPTAAGAVNGTIYRYRAESSDLSQWEIGYGAYNSGTGVFARTTVLYNSAGTTAKISFTGIPQVAVVALKEDLISIEEANSFTTSQQQQARKNILAVGAINKQVFTSSGTYTPSANLLFAIIEAVGGGAGGGGVNGTAGNIFQGGGGGSGGYSRSIASASTIGASQTVTIGAGGNGAAAGANNGSPGGDTSVGTLCIAKGGSGGLFGSTSQAGAGGAGGVSGTGDIAASGQPGNAGIYNAANALVALVSGNGGSSQFGGGAQGIGGNGGLTGINASAPGGGGSGGASNGTGTLTVGGGNGFKGQVIIIEFCVA